MDVMQYHDHNGHPYVPWWAEHFPHHVFVKDTDHDFRLKAGLDAINWLKENYPDSNGDDNVCRYSDTDIPWYDYDWGFSREGDLNVVYFKDGRMATHFKLVWS